ncbi:MAG: BatD family protein [Campylobacterota bacterium]|nr:BatD family protein [Campylobacterota bacterium]
MIKKLLFTLFLMHYGLLSLVSAASVEAKVNTTDIVLGNPVELSITAVGGSAAFPNIQTIGGHKVLGTGTSSNQSFQITTNGMKNKKSTTKSYRFVPTKNVHIPAYIVNISGQNYKTKPIDIKVSKSQAPKIKNSSQFSFALNANKKEVMVGESFLATVYISVSNALRNRQIANYTAPVSKNFFIKEMGKAKEYRSNGYHVIEMRYLVTAKKAGTFKIDAATAKLGEPDRRRQDIFGRYDTKWTPIMSTSLDLKVNAQEKESDLVGDFTIKATLDHTKVKANKPVNLRVEITGEGILEDFELDEYEIENVTVYGDDAKVDSTVVSKKIKGSYVKSFAFIANESFVIPERKISIYNPKSKTMSYLTVPSYRVEVEPSRESMAQNNTSDANHVQIKQTPVNQTSEAVEKTSERKNIPWWMVLVSFVVGLLVMYILQKMPKFFNGKKLPKESEALKILYAHMSEDKEVEEMVRKLYAKKGGDKSVDIDKKVLKEMLERFK